jgi:hypothetical protein
MPWDHGAVADESTVRVAVGEIPTALSVVESVPLLTAWVARLASDLGIRALAIKGPVAAQQGLREPRTSIDVDLWVDPSRHLEYCGVLEQHGWSRRFVGDRHWVLREHSFTMRHAHWACELDVHEYFPGFFAAPQSAFDHLWARRTTADVAGAPVLAVDRVGQAAVLAVHCLRDLRPGMPVHELEYLETLVRDDFDDHERADLARAVAACGANETLRPFLDAVHLAPMPGPRATAAQLEDWRVVTAGHFAPSVAWVDALRKARVREWPAVVWRAFWLNETEIRQVEPGVGSGWWGLLWGRIRRLGRGLRMLPRAVRIVVLRRDS